jgi:transmembrane sensor
MSAIPEPRSIPNTAAEWFAARLASCDERMERRFSLWLAADPRNAEEYELCQLTWELAPAAAEGLEGDAAIARVVGAHAVAGKGSGQGSAHSRVRRVVSTGFAAAACAALVGFAVFWLSAPKLSVWSTAPGQQRVITLADGSHVTLNTRTTLEARMGRARRELRLLSGEAFFDVAKDESRPFVVETRLGTARVVGTRFDVLLEDERVEVATEEGKVLVQPPHAEKSGVLATAGTRATLIRGNSRAALDRADLMRIENWRAHRLEFDRVPLGVALKEFSRYTRVPIRPASTDVAELRISAVLKTGDIEALRSSLNGAFGLSIVERADQWLVIADNGASQSTR